MTYNSAQNKEEIAKLFNIIGDLEKRVDVLDKKKIRSIPQHLSSSNLTENNNTTTNGDLNTQPNGVRKGEREFVLELELQNAHTVQGEHVYVVGNSEEIGHWDAEKAVPLHTSEDKYPNWTATVTFPHFHNEQLKFKFFMKKEGEPLRWESNPDHTFTAPNDVSSAKESCVWNSS